MRYIYIDEQQSNLQGSLMLIGAMTDCYGGGGDGYGSGDDLGMDGVSASGDDGVEAVVVVSCVVDGSECAVGFGHLVRSSDNVSVASFRLGFVVACMGIRYAVVELVSGICLKDNRL